MSVASTSRLTPKTWVSISVGSRRRGARTHHRRWVTLPPLRIGCCLGSGVVQVGTRSPVVVAQTAITLSNLSNGRFLLGLGASGPQVVEGLHGVSFSRPPSRIRGTVDIVRQVFTGGKISYSGKEFQIPRPGGEAVLMRLSTRPEHHIPIYLAALSPAMLRLTGEIADGWLAPASCPKEPQTLTLPTLTPGWPPPGALGRTSTSAKAPKSLSPQTKTNCAAWSRAAKKELAFSLGGMGSSSTNYYNQAYGRQGWADVAAEVRESWQRGDRDGAAGLVTDEMVLATTLIGTEQMVRARLAVWKDAGVNTVRLYPAGDTLDAKLSTLGRAIELARDV